MSEWRKVTDELPETGNWYLIKSDMNMPHEVVVTMAFLDDSDDGGLWLPHEDGYRIHGDSCEWELVTHWMPLPEPPNDKD